MKFLPGYTDIFLDPITGKLASENSLPCLQYGYIWEGNSAGVAKASTALLDVKIDINSIFNTSFIVKNKTPLFPNAQGLSSLDNGLMRNVGGDIEIAKTITIDELPELEHNYIWEGDIENRPQASTALLDVKEDIATIFDTSFILKNTSASFPNAQGLAQIDNGLMRNNQGTIETSATITIDELPNLGVATIEGLPLPAGKIWRGTESNRPEESDALSESLADIIAINARFLTGEFIMGSALVQTAWPKSQFLINLDDGMLKKTGKTLQHAVAGDDYVDVQNGVNPIGDRLPVWSFDNQKFLTNTQIDILNGNDVRGVNSLHATLLQATNSVTSDQNMIARTSMETRQLILFDYNEVHRYTRYVSLKGPASVNQDLIWVMPDQASTTGQVLTDIGNVPLSTDRKLAFRYVLPDNLQNTLLAQGRDASNNPTFVNASLTQDKVWRGNAQNKPEEVTLEIAPPDARYILQQPSAALNNAQSLNQLIGLEPKILKANNQGVIEVAIKDQDYATKETLEQIKAETEAFKDEAQTAAEEASASAEEASASATEASASATEASASAAEATTAAGEATVAAGEATVSAAAASGSATAAGASAAGAALSAIAAAASASSASSSASDADHSSSNAGQSATKAENALNTLLNKNLVLNGSVYGSGLIKNAITTHFSDNPVLPGKGSVTIPVGTTAERPDNPVIGMMRIVTY